MNPVLHFGHNIYIFIFFLLCGLECYLKLCGLLRQLDRLLSDQTCDFHLVDNKTKEESQKPSHIRPIGTYWTRVSKILAKFNGKNVHSS